MSSSARDLLLRDIRSGVRLKPTKTNDRSGPMIDRASTENASLRAIPQQPQPQPLPPPPPAMPPISAPPAPPPPAPAPSAPAPCPPPPPPPLPQPTSQGPAVSPRPSPVQPSSQSPKHQDSRSMNSDRDALMRAIRQGVILRKVASNGVVYKERPDEPVDVVKTSNDGNSPNPIGTTSNGPVTNNINRIPKIGGVKNGNGGHTPNPTSTTTKAPSTNINTVTKNSNPNPITPPIPPPVKSEDDSCSKKQLAPVLASPEKYEHQQKMKNNADEKKTNGYVNGTKCLWEQKPSNPIIPKLPVPDPRTALKNDRPSESPEQRAEPARGIRREKMDEGGSSEVVSDVGSLKQRFETKPVNADTSVNVPSAVVTKNIPFRAINQNDKSLCNVGPFEASVGLLGAEKSSSNIGKHTKPNPGPPPIRKIEYFDHQDRPVSSETATWIVKKGNIANSVGKYSICNDLEKMHQRKLVKENTDCECNTEKGTETKGDEVQMDMEVAKLLGMPLEKLKELRFDIDVDDPQGSLIKIQKRYNQLA